jgi:hypothetical protein
MGEAAALRAAQLDLIRAKTMSRTIQLVGGQGTINVSSWSPTNRYVLVLL